MKKMENGKIVEMTSDEIAAMQEEQAKAEAEEKHRPLTESEVSRMLITAQINTLSVDDQTALRMLEYYPAWEELVKTGYTTDRVGFKFQYNGKLYKTIPEYHTFSSAWVPDTGTESLYVRIDEEHDGSKYDPIPYEGNMILVNGLYYTQGDVLYICSRDTGNPVYNALAELVGLYVEIVQ